MTQQIFYGQNTADIMFAIRNVMGDDAMIVTTSEQEGRLCVIASNGNKQEQISVLDNQSPIATVIELMSHAFSDCRRQDLQTAITLARQLEPLLQMSHEHIIAQGLSKLLRFKPLSRPLLKSVMLVGPAGMGKTVAVAKIAVEAAMTRQDLQIISADILKAGCFAQLASYLSLIDMPLACVANPAALQELASTNIGGVFVVDTAGTNPFDEIAMNNLQKFTQAINIEPILVISARNNYHDSVDIITAFAGLGIERVIISQLDSTRSFENILFAIKKCDMAIADIGASPYIAESLVAASSLLIAKLLSE